jgi:pimeloyl-ACP methyl ester carboxylesterase
MAEGYVEVPGGRLFYEASGTGEPTILIHAGIADLRMWDEQAAALSQRFQVVRYDVRGFGRSSDPAGDFRHHDDLLAILDDMNIRAANLVSVSMAGSIAIDFTLEYPERVRALVLVATGPNGYDRWSDEIRRGWAEENEALAVADIERAIEVNLRMWVDGPRRQAHEVDASVRARVSEMLQLNLPREGEGEALDLEPMAIGRLGEIDKPTLVIVGDEDQPDIIESSRMLARQIRGAQMEEITGVAHLPNMEKAEEFNRLVLGFLASV